MLTEFREIMFLVSGHLEFQEGAVMLDLREI